MKSEVEPMTVAAPSLWRVIREPFDDFFRRPLSVWSVGLLLASINIMLFAYEKPWTASDGMRNWGDWMLYLTGLEPAAAILSPWLYSGSVLNFGLLLGALIAALLSSQFALRVAPPGELVKGIVGGTLMGIGAVCAMGCNIGGFYSALSALSLSGLGMMLGLGLGAYLGLRYLLWEQEHLPFMTSGPSRIWGARSPTRSNWQTWAGGLVIVLTVVLVLLYKRADFGQRGGLLLFGVLLGLLLQRSRFCLVRAFREPFMTGEGEMTRAAAVSLALGLVGFTVLKSTDLRSWEAFVFPSFWQGSLGGGCVFGIGMVLAGGCGSGSLWRAGEGHVKLWLALAAFALSGALTRRFLEQNNLLSSLGDAVFLPDLVGWTLAPLALLGVLAVWYLLAAWNEKSEWLVVE